MNFIYPSGLPLALSLVGYNALLTSLLIVFKRRDRAGAWYFFSSLFTFGWGVGLSFMLNNDLAVASSRLWGRAAQVCFFLMPAAWLHFVLFYTRRLPFKKNNLILCYGVTLFFLCFTPTRWFISGFRDIAGLHAYPIPGPAFKALTVVFFTVLIYCFWEFWDAWREEPSSLKKADSRFLWMTQLGGYSLSSLCLLPAYNVPVPQYQFLVLPLWQFFLAYGLVRYHLLDFEELAKTLHRDRLAALSTITAAMHHEIRNPLTAIQTFAEYLPEKYDNPEFRRKIKEIVPEEVRRISGILNQLLEFSKPEETQLKPAAVVPLLQATLDFFSQQLASHSVRIVENYEEGPEVLADRSQMKQVFLNIFLNSIHAMPEGGTLRVENHFDAEQGLCRILISDTGVGIPKESLKHIYEPYYTTKEKGTGLGLSIVQEIIRKHGGTIHIESGKGEGTRVILTLKTANRAKFPAPSF